MSGVPDSAVAVVAVPVTLPTNVVAVTIPVEPIVTAEPTLTY